MLGAVFSFFVPLAFAPAIQGCHLLECSDSQGESLCYPLWLLVTIILRFVQTFRPFHLIVGSEDSMFYGNHLKLSELHT